MGGHDVYYRVVPCISFVNCRVVPQYDYHFMFQYVECINVIIYTKDIHEALNNKGLSD